MSKEYTTSRGIIVKFRGIAMLVAKIDQQYAAKAPKCPQYEAVGIGGVKMYYDHDLTTLKTDEERAEYDAYLKAKAVHAGKYNEALLRLALISGIDVEYPTDERWVAMQKLQGIEVPDDPDAREIHWRETEVIGNLDDVNAILQGVMGASGASEEDIAAAGESFRGAVGRSAGNETERPDGGYATVNEGVVVQPLVRNGTDSVGTLNANEPVRRARRHG